MAVCSIYYLIEKHTYKFNFRDAAYPGPQIGYLEEIVHWLDYHIKGIKNGYENKESLSIYQLNPNIDELHPIIRERKGQWIHLNTIPDFPNEFQQRNSHEISEEQEGESEEDNQIKYYLSSGSLQNEKPLLDSNSVNKISFLSPEETGTSSGNLLGWGHNISPDNPTDQRDDDGRSLTFDSLQLTNNCGTVFRTSKKRR